MLFCTGQAGENFCQRSGVRRNPGAASAKRLCFRRRFAEGSGRRPMGELPEGRRPDGPVGPPQHDNSMKSGDSAIPLSRNNNPVTQPERRCVSATRISAIRIQDSGRRLGLGAWGQAPAKAGGWTRWPIAPFPDGTGYYVIAEHGRRAPARILPLAPQTSKI